jgi:hypothetical protein
VIGVRRGGVAGRRILVGLLAAAARSRRVRQGGDQEGQGQSGGGDDFAHEQVS